MIKEPMVMEIAKNTYAINEFGLSACYFLVGEERALLIDTACGLSDLKGIAASLTDKPYDVVLTHGHLDHVGGIGAFTDVYLGEADFAMTRNLNAEQLRGFADEIGRNGGYSPYEYIVLRRIDKAKYMLASTELSVKEIAYATGYNSEENFIHSFRKNVGVAPGIFRKYPV